MGIIQDHTMVGTIDFITEMDYTCHQTAITQAYRIRLTAYSPTARP